MKSMTATDARQNFGQFLDYGIQEPVLIKRQKRELGVFMPMSLYKKLVASQNLKVIHAMENLQGEVSVGTLSESELDTLLKEVNPS